MNTFKELNRMFLKSQTIYTDALQLNNYKDIAAQYAQMENAIAVLSDLLTYRSYIYYGGFAETLSIGRVGTHEDIASI